MTNTPNKGFPLQTTGTNVGTWGTVVNNSILSVLDNNLGGTLNISVAGSSNVNLTSSQSSYLIHNLSGVLTGNIDYIFPAAGGFYAINNGTTGAFTVTVQVVGGTGGIIVPQGTTATIYIDASVPAVEAFVGTEYVFLAGTVGGSANALTVSQTFPSAFSLNNATQITIVPTSTNTGAATLNVDGVGAIAIQKITVSGLAALTAGDMPAGVPIILIYFSSIPAWVALNIPYQAPTVVQPSSFTLSITNIFERIVASAAISVTLNSTATYESYFNVDFYALSGAITLIPNGSDEINGVNANFLIPQGASGKLYTDNGGNWYVNFVGSKLNTESSIASAATTNLGSMSSNIGVITGTTTITSFGSAASSSVPFYITRFSGALTLTYNATSLIIPGAANYTTSAGDVFMWKYEGSGNWRCVGYALANGKPLNSAGTSVVSIKSQEFTGSGTYTPSTGMLYCIAEVLGGGGGGGAGSSGAFGSSGGGAGGYAKKVISAASIGTSQTITIGAGGTSATNGGSGGTGGTSSIGALISCTGGVGGTNGNNAIGGAGGSGSGGDINIPGNYGAPAYIADISGAGANSFYGAGGQQVNFSTGSTGNSGIGYGSGGSGSYNNNTSGAGAPGIIYITEYCSQ